MVLLILLNLMVAVRLLFVPLALVYEWQARRRREREVPTAFDRLPHVSVVVPAFNEEKVLESCVRSIIAANYKNMDIIIVDDGSTDNTRAIGEALATKFDQVKYVFQQNAGKGAALNRGYRMSRGEFLLFIDADTVFTPETVPAMLRGFYADNIGAVCGDDRPVNLDRVLTRFLALITHVGTGLVRRAFDVLHVVPVISGNSGAFRRSCLDEIAEKNPGHPLREDTIGEDLELTWQIHASPWRVVFAPRALVYAESPSSFGALFKQRTRWARGLLQGLQIHRRHMLNLSYPRFSLILWFAVLTMVFFPILQAVMLIAALFELPTADLTRWGWLFIAGLGMSTALLIFAMAIAHSLRDLRHIWTLPLWPFYATIMSFTMLNALRQELFRAEQKWNKPERTGVITDDTHLSIDVGTSTSTSAHTHTQPDPERLHERT